MIQAPRGTKDILPENIAGWHFVENVFRQVASNFSYTEFRTPIFESTEVFSRSIGDNTDIVNKEMYTFLDKGGNSMTLRPEMTAALVRAVIQNQITNRGAIARLWYFGPFFRYERPQKGRLRQFHQFGAECLSSPFPESDAEVILLANEIIFKLGIKEYKLNLNTIGNKQSREKFKLELVSYLNTKKDSLSEESKFRLETNPMRVLDSKDERDILATKDAPSILNFLDDESQNHFDGVKAILDSCGIKYEINPRLVRGLDYYCHTVFEFQSSALGAQDAFGGGGRYNDLFEQLGGKPTPAVGFAMGVERLLLILESQNLLPTIDFECDAFIISSNPDNNAFVLKMAQELRSKGAVIETDIMRKSFKSQFKEADRAKAKFAIVLGEDEITGGYASIKNLINGEQVKSSFDNIINIIK